MSDEEITLLKKNMTEHDNVQSYNQFGCTALLCERSEQLAIAIFTGWV